MRIIDFMIHLGSRRGFLRTLTVILLLGLSGRAAEFDAARLSAIPAALQSFVDQGQFSGAVALVADRDRVVHLSAVGFSDLATRRRQRVDDLFWIASMTKPLTAICVLMLQDEGKLSIDDPVMRHLPEFQGQWLLQEKTADREVLVKAPRPITIRDLLTHTSGLGGDVPQPRVETKLAELVAAYAHEPLQFPPGSKWSYSNPGINTLGRIIEVVSGQSYAAFIEARLLRPLGMKDTTFWPSRAQVKRLSKAYQVGADGKLAEVSVYFVKGDLSDRHRPALAAGGLFSTASDVARAYQFMLNRGTVRGRRLLSEPAVIEMTRTQTADIKTGFVDGMSWGLGFQVVKQPEGVTSLLSAGTFGHGGAYGTQSWGDPGRGVVLVLMIQRSGLPNGDASDIRRVFQETALAAVK